MNTNISQGSVATRLGCGGAFVYDCYKFPTESNGERILKIGQYLVKLWARVRCLVFFDSQCIPGETLERKNAKIAPFKCCNNGLPESRHLLLDFFNIADMHLICMVPP